MNALPVTAMPREFDWQVSIDGTLRDVLLAIDQAGTRLAVATDVTGRVQGVMSEGDARRALLGGVDLAAPLAPLLNRDFTAVPSRASRAEVLDLMHARTLVAIPIVEEDGSLIGIHTLHSVMGIERRPNWAIVMAGGRGSRLGTITERIPKPMVRVAGRPILERLVLHLVGFGFQRIFLSINYLGNVIEDHFGDGSKFGCAIEYLREEKPLGTAGALSLLPERPTRPLFVVNGDLVTQANFGAMMDFHERRGQAATIAVRPYFHTVPFGCIELDGSRVVGFEEKPRLSRVINAGMYVLSPHVVELVSPREETTMPALLDACLARNEVVRAFEIEEDWIDVGQRDQLRQARGDFE